MVKKITLAALAALTLSLPGVHAKNPFAGITQKANNLVYGTVTQRAIKSIANDASLKDTVAHLMAISEKPTNQSKPAPKQQAPQQDDAPTLPVTPTEPKQDGSEYALNKKELAITTAKNAANAVVRPFATAYKAVDNALLDYNFPEDDVEIPTQAPAETPAPSTPAEQLDDTFAVDINISTKDVATAAAYVAGKGVYKTGKQAVLFGIESIQLAAINKVIKTVVAKTTPNCVASRVETLINKIPGRSVVGMALTFAIYVYVYPTLVPQVVAYFGYSMPTVMGTISAYLPANAVAMIPAWLQQGGLVGAAFETVKNLISGSAQGIAKLPTCPLNGSATQEIAKLPTCALGSDMQLAQLSTCPLNGNAAQEIAKLPTCVLGSDMQLDTIPGTCPLESEMQLVTIPTASEMQPANLPTRALGSNDSKMNSICGDLLPYVQKRATPLSYLLGKKVDFNRKAIAYLKNATERESAAYAAHMAKCADQKLLARLVSKVLGYC